MKFSENYTIRWHDTDEMRFCRPSVLLTYLEETANHQCAHDGKELDLMRDEDDRGFILTRLELRFYHPLQKGDEIQTSTWISSTRGVSTCREFEITKGNECVLAGSSYWVLLDVVNGSILKLDDYPYDYPRDEAHDFAPPLRIRLPESAAVGTRKIVYSDLDYNGHMNNTRYPDMLMDFLPEGVAETKRPTRMVFIFQSGAVKGSLLTVSRAQDTENPDKYYFQTTDESGKVCLQALVELQERN